MPKNYKYMCLVPGCGKKTEVFSVPSKPALKEKWLKALHIAKCREQDKVCPLHFNKQFVTKFGRLKPGTIPTENLPDKYRYSAVKIKVQK